MVARTGGAWHLNRIMKVELIEKAAEIVGDNQLLVNIVSKRVQQLNHGADPYVPTTPEMGCGDIALTEIIEGKIIWHQASDDELAAMNREVEDDSFSQQNDEKKSTDEPETISVTPNF